MNGSWRRFDGATVAASPGGVPAMPGHHGKPLFSRPQKDSRGNARAECRPLSRRRGCGRSNERKRVLIVNAFMDEYRRTGGTQLEYLWRAFKSGAAMPLSERHLRNILAS